MVKAEKDLIINSVPLTGTELKREIEKIKKMLDLNNIELAEIFGFKNVESFQNSSQKKRLENALIKIIRIKDYEKEY